MSTRQLDQYDITRKLGEGSFAEVFLAKDLSDDEDVAIKISKSPLGAEDYPSTLLREVAFMMELHHENITRLKNVILDAGSVSLVFELMGPNLLDFINDDYNKAFIFRKKFLLQIFRGLNYMHARDIIHRDLTPANILLDLKKENVKIADFGLARGCRVPSDAFSRTGPTCFYMAPEQLVDPSRYTAAVDVWAAGCAHIEMLLGGPLFFKDSSASQLLCIFEVLGVPNEETWPGISKLVRIRSSMVCKAENLAERLKKQQKNISDSEIDLLTRLLCLNPSGRISAEDALQHEYFKDE